MFLAYQSFTYGCPSASGVAAPHLVRNHFVDMSSRAPKVMPKGTVLQMYLDITPGSSICGLSESCHKVPKRIEPPIKIKGFHIEKKTSASAMKPRPEMKL